MHDELGLRPIRIVSVGNVGGRDGAVEPTGTYSRRFPEEITRVGSSIVSTIGDIPIIDCPIPIYEHDFAGSRMLYLTRGPRSFIQHAR